MKIKMRSNNSELNHTKYNNYLMKNLTIRQIVHSNRCPLCMDNIITKNECLHM